MRALLIVLLSTGALLLACSSSSSSSSTTLGAFGCCSIPSAPPGCGNEIYGGEKRTATDDCNTGSDGTIPDPAQPGWTQVKDDHGCPVWTPPASPRMLVCGAAPLPDAGGASADASSD